MIIIRKDFAKHFTSSVYRRAYVKLFSHFPYILPEIRNPHVIELELTNNCNLACIHCHRIKMNAVRGFFDFHLFKKLVDEISTYSIAFLRFVGRGEPSLHPELRQIMEYLKDKRIKVEFCTNGTLFEKYSFTEILNWNIDILDISVDGFDKESYKQIRRNGDYDSLKKKVANFYYTRNKLKKLKPKINIRNVIFPSFKPNQIDNFKTEWLKISDLVCYNILDQIDKPDKSYTRQFNCWDIFFNSHIRWDGQVAICSELFIYGEEKYIGDLNQKELRHIWRNPELQELRLLHYKRNFKDIPQCTQCFLAHSKNYKNPILMLPKQI